MVRLPFADQELPFGFVEISIHIGGERCIPHSHLPQDLRACGRVGPAQRFLTNVRILEGADIALPHIEIDQETCPGSGSSGGSG